jgi:hypothetical protein
LQVAEEGGGLFGAITGNRLQSFAVNLSKFFTTLALVVFPQVRAVDSCPSPCPTHHHPFDTHAAQSQTL